MECLRYGERKKEKKKGRKKLPHIEGTDKRRLKNRYINLAQTFPIYTHIAKNKDIEPGASLASVEVLRLNKKMGTYSYTDKAKNKVTLLSIYFPITCFKVRNNVIKKSKPHSCA